MVNILQKPDSLKSGIYFRESPAISPTRRCPVEEVLCAPPCEIICTEDAHTEKEAGWGCCLVGGVRLGSGSVWGVGWWALGRWKKKENKSQLGGRGTANVCFMTQIISVFVFIFPFAREMSYCTVFLARGRGVGPKQSNFPTQAL